MVQGLLQGQGGHPALDYLLLQEDQSVQGILGHPWHLHQHVQNIDIGLNPWYRHVKTEIIVVFIDKSTNLQTDKSICLLNKAIVSLNTDCLEYSAPNLISPI